MPKKVAVENRDEFCLVVYRYSGRVTMAEIVEAIARASELLAPNRSYFVMAIFDEDADLSELNPTILGALYRKSRDTYIAKQYGPRTAVAVLNGSADARMIVPLFNAMSKASGGIDLGFELFDDIESALQRLGIPLDEGLAIVARAN
jgi:hypothetical protein